MHIYEAPLLTRIYIYMVGLKTSILLFVLGFRDSISLSWIRKLVLITHPTTKKIHPQSYKLLNTLKQTFIQVFIFLIGIPALFNYLQLQTIALVFRTLFLLLTYGYIFFYNGDVITCTKQLLIWTQKEHHFTVFCTLDYKEKTELFYGLSNMVKSFIFLLLYYTPIFIFCLILTSFMPFLGLTILVISQSFFNSAFYFLKNWPYDKFNVAYLEKQFPYMLGYGFMVSIVTNVFFTGNLSIGLYFMISQWMIINTVLFSPPDINEGTDDKIIDLLLGRKKRSELQNGYNLHREKIRRDKEYRGKLVGSMKIVKPALQVTEYLNSVLASKFEQQIPSKQP